MAKQLWLGPILGNNRDRLIERCSGLIEQGSSSSFLYLTASRPLLDLVTNRLLDGERNPGVWGSLPVYLFNGFIRKVLDGAVDASTGLRIAPRVPIDRDTNPLKRSLTSRIIRRLNEAGELPTIRPLANREGCINSIASLIGEIQRAGKSPAEFQTIVDARIAERQHSTSESDDEDAIPLQVDYEQDISRIYAAYNETLEQFQLSDTDADQLRALNLLRGELNGMKFTLPWLEGVKLLVLDGFFDFTPVQGEILKLLIPIIPDVIINVNRDEKNREIFRPFEQTLDHLKSIAEFEVISETEYSPVAKALSGLRSRLFNPAIDHAVTDTSLDDHSSSTGSIRVMACTNRVVEIHAIAREIKRLILMEGYSLSDIALVVRERASYEETILEVLDHQRIPCGLERRRPLAEVPAIRAVVKLLMLVREYGDDAARIRVAELADLIKSGYFRLSEAELLLLLDRFSRVEDERASSRRPNWIGKWDADELENVVAFVGGEIRVEGWLARARQLARRGFRWDEIDEIRDEPEAESEIDESSDEPGSSTTDNRAGSMRSSRSGQRVAREVDPASIAWAALQIERLARLIRDVPRSGDPDRLRRGLMNLLAQLQFAEQIRSGYRAYEDQPQAASAAATLDLRGLEGLRRALAGATKSLQMTARDPETPSAMSDLIDETLRCVRAQTLQLTGANRDGLKVLEATDVRGLRFRAMFIAGLVEGGFPLRPPRDWIYPHDERERLKQYGLTLEDISPDSLLKEEHYFYQAACRATEHLYLSLPMMVDETETVSSYYIEEVVRAAAPIPVQTETVRADYDGRDLFKATTTDELAIAIVRQEERRLHRASREGTLAPAVVNRIAGWARERGIISPSASERIEVERERNSSAFGRFDGAILKMRLAALLAGLYGKDHLFSASELSLYGRCPFKFFAQKTLGLEPRGEAALDLSALDAGKLLHEALKIFFEQHRGKRLLSTDRDKLKEQIREAADAVFDKHERMVPPLNPQVWKLDRGIRKLVLDQFLEDELEVQEETSDVDMRPTYFELGFGMKLEDSDPSSVDRTVVFERADPNEQRNEQTFVRGQIDRVDVAADGTALAYDYKLSKGARLEDMSSGRDLQLHIYLSALEQIFLPDSRIAGGGYYALRGAEKGRKKGMYRSSMMRYTGIGKTTKSNLEDSEWHELREEMTKRIWEFIDGMRRGSFLVRPTAPEQSCPWCDFSAVCRFDKFRIHQKG